MSFWKEAVMIAHQPDTSTIKCSEVVFDEFLKISRYDITPV